eukprot:10196835-Heterocapsa_arctica.AAC.1
MGLEAAGRRLPGFDREAIPFGTRHTGPRGHAVGHADMGSQGPMPGAWRHLPGALRLAGLLSFGIGRATDNQNAKPAEAPQGSGQ